MTLLSRGWPIDSLQQNKKMLASLSRFATVTIVNLAGVKIPVNFKAGDRLFDAIEGTDAADLQGPCGGNCVCGQCHVVLPQGHYVAPGDDEKEVLEGLAHITPTSRLACQVTLTDDFDGVEIKYGAKDD